MKIVIDCTEIGIASLVQAIEKNIRACVMLYENASWPNLKTIYGAQGFALRDILCQITEQVNNGGNENDG